MSVLQGDASTTIQKRWKKLPVAGSLYQLPKSTEKAVLGFANVQFFLSWKKVGHHV